MIAHRRFEILIALLSIAAVAADPPKPEELQDKQVQSTHTITLAGGKFDYQATAGTLVIRGDDNKPTGSIFFVAYTKAGVTEPTKRPVTFAFNGGPGSSSVWLHMGCLGPRRIDVGDVSGNPAPPYKIVDNESTMLDRTDLVFIDPISTGFSRAAPGQDAHKLFHGVEGDIHSVGEFIRTYITKFRRWNSPKFLAGESYGTTRASLLGEHLQGELGIYLNGIVLVSPALNFQTIIFSSGNDLPYVLFLPGYTATAWYHKKLSGDLQESLEKACEASRQFAQGEYQAALFKGTSLSSAEQHRIAERLARLTGLEADWIERKNLRVDPSSFFERLLRNEKRIVGRFDSRFTMPHGEEPVNTLQSDPSYAAVLGPFTASFNSYVRGELKYESDLPYEVLNLRLNWDWGQARNTFLDVSDSLRQALVANRDLRVYVATGYYDMATPILSTEWTLHHIGLEPELTKRIGLGYYEAGHMMYLRPDCLHRLKSDLDKFMDGAVGLTAEK